MSRRRGQRQPGGGTYFANLKPLGNAIAGVVASIPKVSGGDRHSLDSPSLDDRLAKRAAKLARRAARLRPGHDIEAYLEGKKP